jgi:hypothetical protein
MIHPIVGSHYRPPAKAILSILPLGQELLLIPEPENEHDPNAIAVWIEGQKITTNMDMDEVEIIFSRHGLSIEEIISRSWHLGYIPREIAKDLALSGPTSGTLCFGANGGPRIEFNPNSNSNYEFGTGSVVGITARGTL